METLYQYPPVIDSAVMIRCVGFIPVYRARPNVCLSPLNAPKRPFRIRPAPGVVVTARNVRFGSLWIVSTPIPALVGIGACGTLHSYSVRRIFIRLSGGW